LRTGLFERRIQILVVPLEDVAIGVAASTARIAVGVQAGRVRTSGCLACGAVISSSPVGRRFAQHKRVHRQTAAT
jgi:hypothetical protein